MKVIEIILGKFRKKTVMQNFSEGKNQQNIKERKLKSKHAKEAEKIHKNLSEKQVDKMIKDSFPASDPPSTY